MLQTFPPDFNQTRPRETCGSGTGGPWLSRCVRKRWCDCCCVPSRAEVLRQDVERVPVSKGRKLSPSFLPAWGSLLSCGVSGAGPRPCGSSSRHFCAPRLGFFLSATPGSASDGCLKKSDFMAFVKGPAAFRAAPTEAVLPTAPQLRAACS